MRSGVAVAADRRSMSDGRWKFDSRKKKFTVDIKADPKHLDVIEFTGGTKWVMPPGQVNEEYLLRIEHKMPFPPKFLSFFYFRDVPSGFATAIGQYSPQRAYLFESFTTGREYIYTKVDDKYFYVIHRAESITDYNAYGSDFKFRFRYEIMNHEAIYLGGP